MKKIFDSIKVQIVGFYLLASIGTIFLIGVLLYLGIANVVLSETLTSTKMAVDKSGTYIESYVDKIKDISQMMVAHPSTVNYLSGKFSSDEEANREKQSVMALIHSAVDSDPFIESIVIVGKAGQLLSNEKSLDMSMSEDMMKEAWYVDAIHSGSMPNLTSARMQKFSMDKSSWVISLSREIVDRSGTNIGVMVIDLKYDVIADYLSDLDLGVAGYAYILNEQEQIVYHDDTSYFEDENKRVSLIKMARMSDGYDKQMNKLFHQYSFTNADWTLYGVASLDGLDSIRRQLIETIVLVGILGIVLLFVIGTYIASRITNPIRQLEEAMQRVEEGLYEIDILEGGPKEIKSLANHYNIMVNEIRQLMSDITTKEKAIKAYELNVLHSQINPHFLYNTLDTIVWMAEFGDSEKVVEVTKSLAMFFRLSLSGGSEDTTIENELLHVEQYLFIQKERYKDKLNYTISCGDVDIEQKIPKIILQPIVENAIYHGIRHLDRLGNVQIHVDREEDDVVFTVKDDGVGYDKDSVRKEESNTEYKVKLGGVGLKNVDQRLKLAYGDTYGLEVTSILGQGTTVTLRLGKDRKKAYNNP